jgi:hypothetical protein
MSPPPEDKLVQEIQSFVDIVFELSVTFVPETFIDGDPLSGGLRCMSYCRTWMNKS